jgi:hypothetical protein
VSGLLWLVRHPNRVHLPPQGSCIGYFVCAWLAHGKFAKHTNNIRIKHPRDNTKLTEKIIKPTRNGTWLFIRKSVKCASGMDPNHMCRKPGTSQGVDIPMHWTMSPHIHGITTICKRHAGEAPARRLEVEVRTHKPRPGASLISPRA